MAERNSSAGILLCISMYALLHRCHRMVTWCVCSYLVSELMSPQHLTVITRRSSVILRLYCGTAGEKELKGFCLSTSGWNVPMQMSVCIWKFSAVLCEHPLDTGWIRVGRVIMLQAVNFLVGKSKLSDAVLFYAYSEVQATADFCNGQKPIVYDSLCLIAFDSAGWRKATEGATSTRVFSDLSSQRLLCCILFIES